MQSGEQDKPAFEHLDPNIDPWLDERYLSRTEMDSVATELQAEREWRALSSSQYEQLRSEGYKTLNEAESLTGVRKKNLAHQARRLKADEDYLPSGLAAPVGYTGKLFKGAQLRWSHPRSNILLLHPEYVEAQQQVAQQREALIAAGYLNENAALKEFPINQHQLRYRAQYIDPTKRYLCSGIVYEGEAPAETLLGSEIRWQHPYSNEVLYHPDFLKSLSSVYAKEKELRNLGYQTPPELAEELGVEHFTILASVQQIQPNENYLADGRVSTLQPDGMLVQGNKIKWVNPYSGKMLLAPSLIQGIKERHGDNNEWIQMAEAARLLHAPHTTVLNRLKLIDPQKSYGENGLPPTGSSGETILRGSDFTKKFGTRSKYIRRSLVDAWKSADDKQSALLDLHYKTPKQSEEISGGTVQHWFAKIDPYQEYTVSGSLAKEEREDTFQGNELVWKHPYNSNVVLLHPKFVEIRSEGARISRKTSFDSTDPDATYTPLVAAAALVGVAPVTLRDRLTKLDPNKYYDAAGNEAANDTVGAMLGKDFIKQNPHSKTGNILVHKSIVSAWVSANEQYTALQEAGYRTVQVASNAVGLAEGTIIGRILRIQPEGSYTKEGMPIESLNDESLKGKDLYWKHPYSGAILVNPILIDAWQKVEVKEKEWIAKGYQPLSAIEEKTGLTTSALSYRLKNYEPLKIYPDNGELREPLPDEQTVKGQDLFWKHPDKNMVLIHPGLAAGWEDAAKKESAFIEQNYFSLDKAEKYTGISKMTLGVRLQTYDPKGYYTAAGIASDADTKESLKGSELIYRSPYSRKGVLIHPGLVDAWEKAESVERGYVAVGYLSRQQMAEKVGVDVQTIQKRAKQIESFPSINFADQNAPLIWRHPYAGGKKVYYHPSLEQQWKSNPLATIHTQSSASPYQGKLEATSSQIKK